MLFKTLIIAFASSSLAQAYGSNYANANGDYGMNYASSQSNTLSRRACYIDKNGKSKCFTPKPHVEPKEPVRKNCRPGSCWISKNGKKVCDRSEVCELVQPEY